MLNLELAKLKMRRALNVQHGFVVCNRCSQSIYRVLSTENVIQHMVANVYGYSYRKVEFQFEYHTRHMRRDEFTLTCIDAQT